MGQSLVQIYVHLVFSTKNRVPFLEDLEFRARVHAYLAKAVTDQGCPAIEVGGVADHIHCLCRLGKQRDVSTLIAEMKRESSKWIKENSPKLSGFYWQSGYGAFSISPNHVDRLIQYIRNQERHHKKESFQDEFRRLCRIYGVPVDERYAWD